MIFFTRGYSFQIEISRQKLSLSREKSLIQNITEECGIVIFQVRCERGHSLLYSCDWRADKGWRASPGSCRWVSLRQTTPFTSLWDNQRYASEMHGTLIDFSLTWIIRKGWRLEQNISAHMTLSKYKNGSSQPFNTNSSVSHLLFDADKARFSWTSKFLKQTKILFLSSKMQKSAILTFNSKS